jgi:hypothetical protein
MAGQSFLVSNFAFMQAHRKVISVENIFKKKLAEGILKKFSDHDDEKDTSVDNYDNEDSDFIKSSEFSNSNYNQSNYSKKELEEKKLQESEESSDPEDENENIVNLGNAVNNLWNEALNKIIFNADDNIEEDDFDENESNNSNNSSISCGELNEVKKLALDDKGDNRHCIRFSRRLLDFDIMHEINLLIDTMIYNIREGNNSVNNLLYSVGSNDSPFTSGI